MVQWVKEPALMQLWHRLQLQLRFDPWPRNFHMLWVWPKKKKQTNKQKPKECEEYIEIREILLGILSNVGENKKKLI